METEEEEIGVQPPNESTMTRLSTMAPVDSSSWSSAAQRPEQRTAAPALFEPMITNVISEKNLLDPISVSTATSSLHTEEEDVATFLATQLATPQHHASESSFLRSRFEDNLATRRESLGRSYGGGFGE